MGQPTVVKYEDWVGVLQLATMWEFTEASSKPGRPSFDDLASDLLDAREGN
jgi:hypothetical protein